MNMIFIMLKILLIVNWGGRNKLGGNLLNKNDPELDDLENSQPLCFGGKKMRKYVLERTSRGDSLLLNRVDA